MEFIPNTEEDKKDILSTIGLESMVELFKDIPEKIKSRFEPPGIRSKSELEIKREIKRLAATNADPDNFISFMGGGVYDHFIPSVVDHVLSRSEFYTAYTPYQPEISQGTLSWMFEFQTLICELTGMDIANSSMYDGATAMAEAVLWSIGITKKNKVLVAQSINPFYQKVINTYGWGAGLEIEHIPYKKDGRIDKEGIQNQSGQIAAVVVQNPNFFGIIEDLYGLKDDIGNALLIVGVNPISLGVLAPPGDYGADVVVGEGQMLGNPTNFGGPQLGIFASRKKYMRKIPGRLSGVTLDEEGKPGFVMALQTREQHIRREKASSNICTNQGLCALAATVYLSALGKEGFKEMANSCLQKTNYLKEAISRVKDYELEFPTSPNFNEFVIKTEKDTSKVVKHLRNEGFLILGPSHLRNLGLSNHLLLAVTEKRTKKEMDQFIGKLREV
jgi:glycine dehydrogenase subunit 1